MNKKRVNDIETTIANLINKIMGEINNINGKDSFRKINTIKKVIDSVDKLVLLKEKLNVLKKSENSASDLQISIKDKAIIENYLNTRLKHMQNEKLRQTQEQIK